MNIRRHVITMLASVISGLVGYQTCAADSLRTSDRLFQQLMSPMAMVNDGKPFRDSVARVATDGKINIWIDRRIDPSATVNPGSLGPTVYAALKRIAAERGCVVNPVANVVLIGRPSWVDATATSLLPIPITNTRTTLRWNDLTTPTEVLRIAAPKSKLQLPHDQWPRATLTSIQPAVGVNLIYAQFDRKLRGAKINQVLAAVPAAATASMPRRYSATDELKTVLTELNVESKVAGNDLVVIETAAVHRKITDAWLMSMAEGKAVNPNGKPYDLKLEDAPAGAVLNKVAQMAGLQCRIQPNAMERCQAFIALDVEKKTLSQVADIVANQVGVAVTWTKKEIVVSLPK